MNSQKKPPSNGTVLANNGRQINKKKRKRKFFQLNDNDMNSSTKLTSATTENCDINKSLHSTKKRKRNKKNKTPEGSSTNAMKPILIVKTPEDYSANWKMLKEIITQDDKKTMKDKSKFKYRKPKGKLQKINETESTSKKVDVQETLTQEKEKLEVWFDNVDPILLEENIPTQNTKKSGILTNDKKSVDEALVKEESFEGATKAVAMDCEMVGVGMNGKDSIVARVSIVNQFGKVLYDKFVKPTEEVVDYRTAVSGIRPEDLIHGHDFSIVQKEVSDLIEGRILVGHAVHNDLRILFLSHPRSSIRDSSRYKAFKRQFGGRTPSLKKLVERFLGVQIQQGEHNSVQDAQAAMRLYTMHRREWEKSRPNKYKIRHLAKKEANSAKKKEQSSEDSKGN